MQLRDWRHTNKLTLDQMAEGLGTSGSHLSNIETGKRSCSATFAKRIEAYTKGEVTAASLLGLDEADKCPSAHTAVREEATAFAPEAPLADRPWRKPVTVTVDLTLTAGELEDIREYVLDVEAVAREAGLKAIRAAYKAAWGEANRDAIEAYNKWIAEHGTFAEQMGLI